MAKVGVAVMVVSCVVGDVKIVSTSERGAITAVTIVTILWMLVLSHHERVKVAFVL